MDTFRNKKSEETSTRINDDATIILTGDTMLGGEFLTFRDERNLRWEYPFEKVKHIFENVDIVFGNLECPLSNDGPVRADKAMVLYAPFDSVRALKYLSYTVVSLANNHINDYGGEGLIKTTELLKREGIYNFGAGRDIKEANREVIIERNGLKICFLGYTTSEEHVKSIIADADTAGCVFYDFKRIKEDIDRVKKDSDIICISLHWGFERYLYPSPEQVELAHQIIDTGAHIVMGHHPHVIQGFERYKHGLIFYSLGNFFFPNFYTKSGVLHEWREENNKSIIAKCKVGRQGVEKIKILFSFMNTDYQVELLDGKDKEEAIFEIERLSKELGKDCYDYFWNAYIKEKNREMVRALPKRMKELGVEECIQRISVGNIKNIGKLLIEYMGGLVGAKRKKY